MYRKCSYDNVRQYVIICQKAWCRIIGISQAKYCLGQIKQTWVGFKEEVDYDNLSKHSSAPSCCLLLCVDPQPRGDSHSGHNSEDSVGLWQTF